MTKATIKKNLIAVSVVVIGVLVGLVIDKMFNVSDKTASEGMRLVG